MSEQVQIYLNNQISKIPAFLDAYLHDRSGKLYAKRHLFDRVMSRVNNFLQNRSEVRFIGISGLRGVGKTTLLAQLSKEIISKYPKDFLYLTMDEVTGVLQSDLLEVLTEYEKIIGCSFEEIKRPVFIFIDEVHFDEKWTLALKTIYDKSKHIFVICTGSSALSLRATPDLARRILFEKLYPMKFSEYIFLKNHDDIVLNQKKLNGSVSNDLSAKIVQALLYSPSGKSCYESFLKLEKDIKEFWYGLNALEMERFLKFGNLPFALKETEEFDCLKLILEIIDRIVEKDIPALGKFKIETLSRAKNILLMLASGDETSFTSFAKSLNNISIITLQDLFDAFEKAEILFRVYPYGSAFKKVRKPSKYLFMSPSLRYALLSVVEGRNAYLTHKGKYLEDVVCMTLISSAEDIIVKSLFYDSSKGGADFIIKIGDKKIVLEVGFGEKGNDQILYTMRRTKANYGVLISETELNFDSENNIVKIPLQTFLSI